MLHYVAHQVDCMVKDTYITIFLANITPLEVKTHKTHTHTHKTSSSLGYYLWFELILLVDNVQLAWCTKE